MPESSADPHPIIAIDGPAASGKSTVARRVARELGLVFVNSGAMYRAFTWQALRKGVDCSDRAAVLDLLERTDFQCGEANGDGTVRVDGDDPGDALNGADVNANVSIIAAYPEVRERLVAAQRAYADTAGVVMEGRDIGTAVFPGTPHKFYIDADPEVRARRRQAQGLADSIADRDRRDSSRAAAPLSIAPGAEVIDSSDLDADGVVAAVLKILATRGLTPRATRRD
ncbi:MAG: (d)CMP kinase [Verrucomicrobiae bacterium]|nr:(d)CMP kinase [Verrucomicrobiae bacterium]MCP5541340.1 (d)CMP kinase [Akkermansiaceae bacterium]